VNKFFVFFQSFLFPWFTLTSAGLAVLVWWFPGQLPRLASPLLGGIGIVLILGAIGGYRKARLSLRLGYDLFLLGTLFCWLAFLLPVFGPQAPLFKAYPIFFLVNDVMVKNVISIHKARMNAEEHRFLAALADQWWFSGMFLGGLVLIGLMIPGHYLFYPAAVGLMTVRRGLEEVLSPYEKS